MLATDSIQDPTFFGNTVDRESTFFSLINHKWYRAPHGSGWMRLFIKNFSAKHAVLYHVICRHSFGEFRDALVTTYKHLSEWTGMSLSTVKRQVADLRSHGVISVKRGRGNITIVPKGQDVPFDKCIPQITDCAPYFGPYATVVLHALIAKVKMQLNSAQASSFQFDPYQCQVTDSWLKTIGVPENQIQILLSLMTRKGWVKISYASNRRQLTLMSIPVNENENVPIRCAFEFDDAESLALEIEKRSKRRQIFSSKVANNPTSKTQKQTDFSPPFDPEKCQTWTSPQIIDISTVYGQLGESGSVSPGPTKEEPITKDIHTPRGGATSGVCGVFKNGAFEEQEKFYNKSIHGDDDSKNTQSGPPRACEEIPMPPRPVSWTKPIHPLEDPIIQNALKPWQLKQIASTPNTPQFLSALYSSLEFMKAHEVLSPFGLIQNAITRNRMPSSAIPEQHLKSWAQYLSKRYFRQIEHLTQNGATVEFSPRRFSITHPSHNLVAKTDDKTFFYRLEELESSLHKLELPNVSDPSDEGPPILCAPKNRLKGGVKKRDAGYQGREVGHADVNSMVCNLASKFRSSSVERSESKVEAISEPAVMPTSYQLPAMCNKLKKEIESAKARARSMDPERMAAVQLELSRLRDAMERGEIHAPDFCVPLHSEGPPNPDAPSALV